MSAPTNPTRPANDNAHPVARRPRGGLCAGAPCKTCNGARECREEPSRNNPSGVRDCPDCG